MTTPVSELTKSYFFPETSLMNVYSTPPNLSLIQITIDSLTSKEKNLAKTIYKYNISVLFKSLSLLKENPLLSISIDYQWRPCISFVVSLIDKLESIEKKVKMYIFWQFLNNLICNLKSPFHEDLEGSIETHFLIDVQEQKKIFINDILPYLKNNNAEMLCKCLFFETLEQFFNPDKFLLKKIFIKKIQTPLKVNVSFLKSKKIVKSNASPPLKIAVVGKLLVSKHTVSSIYSSLRNVISSHEIYTLDERDFKYISDHLFKLNHSFFLSMLIYVIEHIYCNINIEPIHLYQSFQRVNITFEYDYFESVVLKELLSFRTNSLEKSIRILCDIIYSNCVKQIFMEI